MNLHLTSSTLSFEIGQQIVASFVNRTGRLVGLYQAGLPVDFQPVIHEAAASNFRYSNTNWLINDHLELITGGLYHCTWEWKNISGQPQEVTLVMDLYRPDPVTSYIIPAVSYNNNPWGNGHEPKGITDEVSPDQAPWVFGSDHPSIPACTMTESDRAVIALYTSEALANQSACSLHPLEDNGMTQRIAPGR